MCIARSRAIREVSSRRWRPLAIAPEALSFMEPIDSFIDPTEPDARSCMDELAPCTLSLARCSMPEAWSFRCEALSFMPSFNDEADAVSAVSQASCQSLRYGVSVAMDR